MKEAPDACQHGLVGLRLYLKNDMLNKQCHVDMREDMRHSAQRFSACSAQDVLCAAEPLQAALQASCRCCSPLSFADALRQNCPWKLPEPCTLTAIFLLVQPALQQCLVRLPICLNIDRRNLFCRAKISVQSASLSAVCIWGCSCCHEQLWQVLSGQHLNYAKLGASHLPHLQPQSTSAQWTFSWPNHRQLQTGKQGQLPPSPMLMVRCVSCVLCSLQHV